MADTNKKAPLAGSVRGALLARSNGKSSQKQSSGNIQQKKLSPVNIQSSSGRNSNMAIKSPANISIGIKSNKSHNTTTTTTYISEKKRQEAMMKLSPRQDVCDEEQGRIRWFIQFLYRVYAEETILPTPRIQYSTQQAQQKVSIHSARRSSDSYTSKQQQLYNTNSPNRKQNQTTKNSVIQKQLQVQQAHQSKASPALNDSNVFFPKETKTQRANEYVPFRPSSIHQILNKSNTNSQASINHKQQPSEDNQSHSQIVDHKQPQILRSTPNSQQLQNRKSIDMSARVINRAQQLDLKQLTAMISKQAENQQQSKLTPTFESSSRSTQVVHGPKIINEQNSFYSQRDQQQTPEPRLSFTEELLFAFQDPKVNEQLTDLIKDQLLCHDVTDRLSKMLVAITERYAASQLLQSQAVESQQQRLFAQEKLEVLSVVAAQITQRDTEILNVKEQIEQVIESQELRGQEIKVMEELQQKNDVLFGLKIDTLTNELENMKLNWSSEQRELKTNLQTLKQDIESDRSQQQMQESLDQSVAILQFQLNSQHELFEQRLSKLHSTIEELTQTTLAQAPQVAQIANLEPIHDMLQKRLQSLNTDLLSATSKLILLSEQKCGQQIVNECQKILPLSLLACTQTLEKSQTVVGLQRTVERLVAHCGIATTTTGSTSEGISECEGEEIKANDNTTGAAKKKRKKNNR